METATHLFLQINKILWGPLMLVLILGTGLLLMVGLKFRPIVNIGYAFRLLFSKTHQQSSGEISPFQALMTALSATVGTGNIVGVATAIFIGGPGALFWMWVTALVGMATKFSEAVLAVHYREVDAEGSYVGGPMYYIKNGLGKKWCWLGTLFAIFAAIASFGIGNTVQANAIASIFYSTFQIPHWVTGLVVALLIAAILLGGIQRIGKVAGALVPFMAIGYLLIGLVILASNAAHIPAAFYEIFHEAFTPTAAKGAFAGATIWLAIQYGVARGVFSNEAGLGSAPIAHAVANTNSPVRQGIIAMLGTFIDTLVVCSITGLVIVITGAWTTGLDGAAMTAHAFSFVFASSGRYMVTFALSIFAFTTILGWSFYSERCFAYLFGKRIVKIFRLIWVLLIPVGATVNLTFIWLVADSLNAMMAIPNLIALLLLSPVIFKLANEYFANKKA